MLNNPRRFLFPVLLLLAFAPLVYRALTENTSWEFNTGLPALAAGQARPLYREQFVNATSHTALVHSSAIAPTDDGRLLTVWYGGSREGATDVALFQSYYNPAQGIWEPETRITDPATTQRQTRRFINKVGNPVLFNDGRGRLWLFYVTVTVGGWSGGAINLITSDDSGASWSRARRLITSPFLNVSTLVKGAPFLYADGSLGLPVYHELMGKFGELLRIDTDGTVRDKIRLSWGRDALQPSIVPLSAHQAVALLRHSGKRPRRILMTNTEDGGSHWTPVEKTELPNPNAGIMALRTQDRLLLVFNNTEKDRYNLSLAESFDNGQSWRVLHAFENHPYARQQMRFAYPYLIQTQDGLYHLVYTWNKPHIKHVVFNQAWLERLKR